MSVTLLSIHADSLALFALNIEILLADVAKLEISNISILTRPVTPSVTSRSNFTPCLENSRIEWRFNFGNGSSSLGDHRGGGVHSRSLFITRTAVSQRTTRSTEAGALELPTFRLSMSRRAFSYRAASSWNRLSQAVTGSGTRAELLRRLWL